MIRNYCTSPLALIIIFFSITFSAVGQANKQKLFINPTGTYKKEGMIINGDTVQYGTIKVELIDKSKLFMDFSANRGAPSYNTGTFTDTLVYMNNSAIYKTGYDSTCTIIFRFSGKGLNVDLKAKDFYFHCGFGYKVDPAGFYKKVSSKYQ